jgi:hypothetical protein
LARRVGVRGQAAEELRDRPAIFHPIFSFVINGGDNCREHWNGVFGDLFGAFA